MESEKKIQNLFDKGNTVLKDLKDDEQRFLEPPKEEKKPYVDNDLSMAQIKVKTLTKTRKEKKRPFLLEMLRSRPKENILKNSFPNMGK